MLFRNRNDAALKLVPHLEKYKPGGLVMAIPRGGVPIGNPIAKKLGIPMDLLLAKKIGHPLNPELAIGAVTTEGQFVEPGHQVPTGYINTEISRIREVLNDRHKKYMGTLKPHDMKGKNIIIVDDGVATGSTILAAIEMLRRKDPARIIVAVPVSAPQAAEKIRKKADDFICLYTPDSFLGVGQFYFDFSEVDDNAVMDLLMDANLAETKHEMKPRANP
jgi:predicted phosphoribosyltransferase